MKTNSDSRKTQRLSTNYLVVSETKIARQTEALVSFEGRRKSFDDKSRLSDRVKKWKAAPSDKDGG